LLVFRIQSRDDARHEIFHRTPEMVVRPVRRSESLSRNHALCQDWNLRTSDYSLAVQCRTPLHRSASYCYHHAQVPLHHAVYICLPNQYSNIKKGKVILVTGRGGP
jgi:hypothetical protein